MVANARQNALSATSDPIYYFPYKQLSWGFGSVILKTSESSRSLEKSVRNAISGLDGEATIYEVRTMDELATDLSAGFRFSTVLLTSFAAITLLLTAIGLYGTLAYSVELRRREFGIRIALGAAPGQVLSAVVQKAALLLAAGLLAGTVLSMGVERLLKSLTFVVSQGMPGLLLVGCVVLTMTSLIAAIVPALKASSIDPTETLRQE